jgi:peptidoglycan hydrolase CwlO-like protein
LKALVTFLSLILFLETKLMESENKLNEEKEKVKKITKELELKLIEVKEKNQQIIEHQKMCEDNKKAMIQLEKDIQESNTFFDVL